MIIFIVVMIIFIVTVSIFIMVMGVRWNPVRNLEFTVPCITSVQSVFANEKWVYEIVSVIGENLSVKSMGRAIEPDGVRRSITRRSRVGPDLRVLGS